VSESLSWQTAFVAATVALGDSVEEARASLAVGAVAGAAEILADLASTDRARRAKAVASVLSVVSADVEDQRLA
jgi:hypothetical protein